MLILAGCVGRGVVQTDVGVGEFVGREGERGEGERKEREKERAVSMRGQC